jgi:hypothetical protein
MIPCRSFFLLLLGTWRATLGLVGSTSLAGGIAAGPTLTDKQVQMLIDNATRRLDKIHRIEIRLEKLKQKYPKAKMFAIVQEQLEEIKLQLGTM